MELQVCLHLVDTRHQRVKSKSCSLALLETTNIYAAGIYLLKFNNRNTRARCSSKSIVNFEHVTAGWVHTGA